MSNTRSKSNVHSIITLDSYLFLTWEGSVNYIQMLSLKTAIFRDLGDALYKIKTAFLREKKNEKKNKQTTHCPV